MVRDRRSLPPGVETTIYRDLTQALNAQGRKVALDTSGETLNHAIERCPPSLSPTFTSWRAGGSASSPVVTRLRLRHGSWWVGESIPSWYRWEKGACFVSGEGVLSQRHPPLKSVARLVPGMQWLPEFCPESSVGSRWLRPLGYQRLSPSAPSASSKEQYPLTRLRRRSAFAANVAAMPRPPAATRQRCGRVLVAGWTSPEPTGVLVERETAGRSDST